MFPAVLAACLLMPPLLKMPWFWTQIHQMRKTYTKHLTLNAKLLNSKLLNLKPAIRHCPLFLRPRRGRILIAMRQCPRFYDPARGRILKTIAFGYFSCYLLWMYFFFGFHPKKKYAPAIEDALILNADPSNAEVLHQTLDAKLLNF